MAGARLTVALGFALLLLVAAGAGAAYAATMPETDHPLAARESTPLCSPECEVISAPSQAPGETEYQGSGPGGGFTPQELREAYGLPEHGGGDITVAVIDDLGDPAAEEDLAVYREHFGLPECTEQNGCFRQLNEHGRPRTTVQWGSWYGEISLDLDMVSAACPECRIDLFEGSGRQGRLEAIESAVAIGADVITNSWNMGFEEGNPANSAVACEIELCITKAEEEEVDPRLDHPGVPILFSGGDYGYAVRFPAASPYVISVGGTKLTREPAASRGWSEEVWSDPSYGKDRKGRGGGGGCSIDEPKPAWETDTSCAGRIDNDVAADADPESPVAVYDSEGGGWLLDGGTSASAPFLAGVVGLSSAASRHLGAAAFWRAGEAGELFDVTTGSVGTCTPPAEDAYWCAAASGFDAPTGWGTPDGPLEFTAAPSVTTEPADPIETDSAVLRAHVDDEGATGGANCIFQVTGADDPSFDTPFTTLPCEPGSVEGRAAVPVEATASGLSPHTDYLFRVGASNVEGGPVYGAAQAFTTLPEPPEAVTDQPGPVTRTTAELRAHVDNEGARLGTTCVFEVTDPGDVGFLHPVRSASCDPYLVEGEGNVQVDTALEDLPLNTTYLYRIEATSAGGGPVIGETVEFTTLPEPPAVTTGGVELVTTESAVLRGRVDDEGDLTGSTCEFEVTTLADTGFASPLVTVPCNPETIQGEEEVAVTAPVSGLAPQTEYRYRIGSTNRGGSVRGVGRIFTTESEPKGELGPGSGSGPVIAIGPPDETELARLAAASTAAVKTPVAPAPVAPSNEFTLGAARIRNGVVTLSVAVPGPGTVAVAGGSAIRKTDDQAIAAGSLTVRVDLSAAARRRAAHVGKLRVSLRVTFTPTGGRATTKQLSVVVRRASGR